MKLARLLVMASVMGIVASSCSAETLVVKRKKKERPSSAQREESCKDIADLMNEFPALLRSLADVQEHGMGCVGDFVQEKKGALLSQSTREGLTSLQSKVNSCKDRMARLTADLQDLSRLLN